MSPLWAIATFLVLLLDPAVAYTMNVVGYGSIIPAKVFWDGGVVVNLSGCTWKVNYTSVIPNLILNTTNASEPFTLAGSASLRATVFPTGTAVANNSIDSNTTLLVTIRPAPGFVTATNISLVGSTVNSTFATGCNSTNATTNITVLASPDGGFASYDTTAVNEFDIQRVGINVTVTLRYNTFWWWPRSAPVSAVPQVTTSGATLGYLINSSGWNLTLLSPYQLLAVHGPVPGFDLNASDVAMVAFNISGLTYLPNRPASPSGVSFSIVSVDGTPLAFCVPSTATVPAGSLRSGVVNVTLALSPSNKDFFINDSSAWAGVVPVPAGSVFIDYTVASTQAVILSFSAIPTFYTDTVINMLFQVPASLLLSRTAGCGFSKIAIVPSSGVATGPPVFALINNLTSTNMTEVAVNEAETCFTFQIALDHFLPGARVLANVTRIVVNGSLTGGFDWNFSTAVAPRLYTQALSADATSIDVCIPPTPAYNIPEGVVENVTFWFPGTATAGGNPPAMVNASVLIRGVTPTLSVTFASTNNNSVNATLLWDAGDTMMLRVRGEMWLGNGTLRNGTIPGSPWSTLSPRMVSSNQSLTPFLSSFVFSNVTLSNFSRDANLTIAPSPGIAVVSNELFAVDNVSPLFLGPRNAACPPAPFTIMPPLPTEINYTCGGACPLTVTQSAVRSGISFSVTAKYDQFDPSAMMFLSGLDIIQNVSLTSFADFTNRLTVSFSRFNTIATFMFPATPLYDFPFTIPVTGADVLRIVPPAAFMRSRTVNPFAQSAPLLMSIVPSRHPTCTLTLNTPNGRVNEGDVRNGDVPFTVTSTSNFYSDICSSLYNMSKAVTATNNIFNLNITAAPVQCDLQMNTSRSLNLSLIIAQSPSYDIAQVNIIRLEINLTFFTIVQRCSAVLLLPISVLPGTAIFSYTGVVFGTTASVNETTLRSTGMNITVLLGGETPNQCWFLLNTTVISADTVQPETAFVTINPKLNATVAVGSLCVVNVTKQPITFIVTIPALPKLDVGMNEVMNFSVPTGINADLPSVVNGQFTIVAVPEVLLVYCNNSDMNPSAQRVNGTANVTSSMRYIQDPMRRGVFVLEIDEEAVAEGGFSFNLTLLGDRWLPNAATLVANQVQITNQTANNAPSKLFSNGLISLSGQTLFFTVPPLPDFFVVMDHLVTVSIPTDAVTSGIVPVPSSFVFYIKSAPPVLIASGPALSGGTRELLLGQLYLTIQLQNDQFLSSTLSAFQVCPPEFDTCSIALDNTTKRSLNITFPPQNIVLFQATTYSINITSTNVATGRNLSNVVQFTLAVQSGILTLVESVSSGFSLPSLGGKETARITEDMIRNGGLTALRFTVEGDSFVGDGTQVVAGLLAGIRCSPSGTTYGFCSRSRSIISGNPPVVYIDQLKQQVIAVTFQADILYDIYDTENVTFSFSGLATTSGFATVALSDLTLQITPVAGIATISISQPSLSTIDIAQGTTVPVLITIVLVGEQWMPNATEQLVRSFSGQSLLPRSFMYEQLRMFLPLVVSADSRVGLLYLKPDPLFNLAANDTILLSVSKACVLSDIPPEVGGGTRLTITSPTALLTFSTPWAQYPVSALRSGPGIIFSISIQSVSGGTFQWRNASEISLAGAMSSSLTATEAPNGFSAQASKMLPQIVNITQNITLTIRIPTSSDYSLVNEPENITLTINQSWVVPAASSIFPLQFSVQVLPDQAGVTLIIPNTAAALSQLAGVLSAFLSVPTSCILVGTPTPLLVNSAFLNVTVQIGCSYTLPTGGLRTPTQAVDYLLASSSLRTCCNISLATRPGVAVPVSELLAALAQQSNEGSNGGGSSNGALSKIWIWISIAVVVIVCAAGVVLYFVHVGSTFSGRNRERREEPEIAAQRLVLTELHDMPSADGSLSQRLLLAKEHKTSMMWDDVNRARRAQGVEIGGVWEPSLADPSVQTAEVDVDEHVFVSQPSHVLQDSSSPRMMHQEATTLAAMQQLAEAMDAAPLTQEDTVAVYPSTIDGSYSPAEHRKKFRPPRRGDRF